MTIRSTFIIILFTSQFLTAQTSWTGFSENDISFARTQTPESITEMEVEEIIADEPTVVLRKFKHDNLGETTILNWESEAESANAYFMVQRSVDGGKTFETIAEIEGANKPCQYIHLDDLSIEAGLQYRLAQVSDSGTVFLFCPW